MVQEIVAEMDYLRSREQKLRDTNESTNNRVKWFAFGTMGMLVALGAWQVIYLRAYFRYVSRNTKSWNGLLTYTQIKASHLGYGICEWRGIVGDRFSAAMGLVLLVAVENRYIMTIQRRARSAL